MAAEHPYETMDLFYLGREIDPQSGKTTTAPLLYKNKNLTTHAAIIGMTGSGKTGLGMGILEEAAIDKIPALVIDPKGDMGNLLLSFPKLDANDFLPWIEEDKASRKGLSREELAKQTAADWKKGLESWDQDGERIQRMRSHTDFTIYTPGSSAGNPISVLDGLEAPDTETLKDNDTLTGLVNAAVSSILALVGIKGDPLQSREHILLASVILYFWRQEQSLDLEALVRAVVDPPFSEIGAFPLDGFYPQAKRMELAMQLNNILASPSFSAWMQGELLQMEHFLSSSEGKTKTSIFSIGHLSDQERMFFVTMLLSRLISWMRRQEGASGLRCILYMDEIFGYFPPIGNPPSKEPMLLLLKQARAFGIGVVLSTQNPVDLDYKGLSNIGTWFIGRLQTKQDQDRVLTGISGSSDTFDKEQLRTLLSDMRGRTFLMRSAHLDEPILFETRWVLSYLKGPLSLPEIERLCAQAPADSAEQIAEAQESIPASTTNTSGADPHPPMLPKSVTQYFVPSPVPAAKLLLRPFLFGRATVRFFNQKRNIDRQRQVNLRLELDANYRDADWQKATPYPLNLELAQMSPPQQALFLPLPAAIASMKNVSEETKSLAEHLYRSKQLPLLRVESLDLESNPDESREQFMIRLKNILAEKKEAETAKIEEQFRKKQEQLENRLNKAYARLEKEKGDVSAKTVDTVISFGMAALGAFLGKKAVSISTASRTSRGMRGAGRIMKEKGDVNRAEEAVALIEQDIEDLAVQLQEETSSLNEAYDPAQYSIEEFAITPRRADIFNVEVALVWEPQLGFSETSFTGDQP